VTLIMAYELGLALATTLSLLAVLLGGALSPAAWLFLPVPTVAAILHARGRTLPAKIGTWVGAVVLVGAVAIGYRRGIEAVILAAAYSLMGLLCVRMLTRQSLRHDLQALLVSLLIVLAGSVVNLEITYGIVLAFYAVAAVWALTSRQLVYGVVGGDTISADRPAALRRRDIVTPTFLLVTAVVSIAILAGTSVLFVVFPRVGLGVWGQIKRADTLFPDGVSLLDRPRAGLGDTVVARVRGITYGQFASGLYLRGAAFARLDPASVAWSAQGRLEAPIRLPSTCISRRTSTYDVYLQPIAQTRLFALGPVADAGIVSGVGLGPLNLLRPSLHLTVAGELVSTGTLLGPVRYRVTGSVLFAGDSSPCLSMGAGKPGSPGPLTLPERLDGRIVELAHRITQSATDAKAKADGLRTWLRGNCVYDLTAPPSRTDDPLATFLLADCRGHCEFFASGFGVMLRAVGVPSRVIGGFFGGTWDDDGGVVVFSTADAHAWVEWQNERGEWVVDDATPTSLAPPRRFHGLAAWWEKIQRAWDDHVLDYGIAQQVELAQVAMAALPHWSWSLSGESLRRVGQGLVWIAVVAACFLVVTRVRRRSRPESGRVSRLCAELLRAAELARGRSASPDETVREVVSSLTHSPRPGTALAAPRLSPVLEAYEAERFGGRFMARDEVEGWRRTIASTRRSLTR